METVADLLRHKYPQFNKIVPNRSVHDAMQQMHAENVDYLIVMEGDRFAGVLTEHDIAEKIVYRVHDLDTAVVKEFMSTYLPVATLNDSLEYCMQLMEQYNVKHLAIYDRFTFKGVISSHDLMKQILLKRSAAFSDDTGRNNPWTH